MRGCFVETQTPNKPQRQWQTVPLLGGCRQTLVPSSDTQRWFLLIQVFLWYWCKFGWIDLRSMIWTERDGPQGSATEGTGVLSCAGLDIEPQIYRPTLKTASLSGGAALTRSLRSASAMLTAWQVSLIMIMSLKGGTLTSPASADSPAPAYRQEYSQRGETEKREENRRPGSFFNDFLHIRIICHFN